MEKEKERERGKKERKNDLPSDMDSDKIWYQISMFCMLEAQPQPRETDHIW